MQYVFLIAGGLVIGALLAFVGWRYVAMWRASRESTRVGLRLMDELEPVWKPVYAGNDPNPVDVANFAANPQTRETLFDFLLFHKKLSQFPNEYRTPLALAESQLVRWLMHPNELGCAPDKIEFVATASPNTQEKWLVFRFRTDPPHWAAEDGWMAGVVGPFSSSCKLEETEDIPDSAPVVFSMFRAFDSLTPQEHATACQKLFSRKI